MSGPKRIIAWAPEAREQLRDIDRETAIHVLHAIDDYLLHGIGDVKKLRPPRDELRLCVGDYRVLFFDLAPRSIFIVRVKHRSEAYR